MTRPARDTAAGRVYLDLRSSRTTDTTSRCCGGPRLARRRLVPSHAELVELATKNAWVASRSDPAALMEQARERANAVASTVVGSFCTVTFRFFRFFRFGGSVFFDEEGCDE